PTMSTCCVLPAFSSAARAPSAAGSLMAKIPRRSGCAWSASSAALYPISFAPPLSSSVTMLILALPPALCASITSLNPFTRSKHDGADLLDNEILDLVALLRHVFVGADNDGVVTPLLAFGPDVVANDFEERIVQREQRNANRAFGRRTGGGRASGGLRGIVRF